MNVTSRSRRAAFARATSSVGDVGPEHLEVRPLVLQRQRDRARARPDVDDARPRRQAERRLDHVLGLRPRDQHAPVDHQLDEPKALDAGDVRDRLALAAPPHGVHERARLGPGELTLRVRDQHAARSTPIAAREQHLRVQPRRVAARRGQRDHRRVERVADRGGSERLGGSTARLLEPLALLGVLERRGQLVELAGEQRLEVVRGEVDPVVGHAPLREVVGADLLRALAACRPASGGRRPARPAARRAWPRRAARAAPSSPARGSAAATSRPASRPRRRSACA